jgi:hypothetical protein
MKHTLPEAEQEQADRDQMKRFVEDDLLQWFKDYCYRYKREPRPRAIESRCAANRQQAYE